MQNLLATSARARRIGLVALALAACATATAGTAQAATAAPVDPCPTVHDVQGMLICYHRDGPTPPPCDVDQTTVEPGTRQCTLAVPKPFVFEAIDLVLGPNKCTVTLKASAPEDQFDQPNNRPKIGYRTTLECEKQLRIINFTPQIFRATGEHYHSAAQVYCHSNCGLTASVRGDVHANRGEAFVMRVPIHMRLFEGPDPWIHTPPDAKPMHGPTSCSPLLNGYDVFCILEIPVTTADQNPDIPHLAFPR